MAGNQRPQKKLLLSLLLLLMTLRVTQVHGRRTTNPTMMLNQMDPLQLHLILLSLVLNRLMVSLSMPTT